MIRMHRTPSYQAHRLQSSISLTFIIAPCYSKDKGTRVTQHQCRTFSRPLQWSSVPSFKPVVGTPIASGEFFEEMALLMNYPSKRGVRAVVYVEVCVLERTKFQQLLARYPEDRRRVLRSMLAACVTKRKIPFTRKEFEQKIARKRQNPIVDSDHGSKRDLVEALLGSLEQPFTDQTNRRFKSRVPVDYAGEFIKTTPRPVHRRRSE